MNSPNRIHLDLLSLLGLGLGLGLGLFFVFPRLATRFALVAWWYQYL